MYKSRLALGLLASVAWVGVATAQYTPTNTDTMRVSQSNNVQHTVNAYSYISAAAGGGVSGLGSNNTWTGSNAHTGAKYFSLAITTLPTQAAGTLGLSGEATAPTLGANGEADIYITSTTYGLTLGGKGSVADVTITNDANTKVADVLTGSAFLNLPGGLEIAGVPMVSTASAPVYASGGCTTQSAVTGTSTAAFSIEMTGTCSGSEPIVFTLPAATTSWACTARDVTHPTYVVLETGAISTTAVTITNYGTTPGTGVAWVTSDVVEVRCTGY